MATTIGDSISRVRNVVKAVKEDPFLTDRFLYSLIMKYAKSLIKRDSRMENLYKNESLFKEIPCLELIDSNPVEACCIDIKTGCTFKRSKEKLPKIEDVNGGPIIRAVTSLDYSQRLKRIQPEIYANLSKTSGFKYNKKKYYWLMNDYLFVIDVPWEAVRLQAMFDEDISPLLCNIDSVDEDACKTEQERALSIPDHLFSEIEQMVLAELTMSGQLPPDGADDSQNVLR